MRHGRIIYDYKDRTSLFPELNGKICTLRINDKDVLEPMDLSRMFADLQLRHRDIDLKKIKIESDRVEIFILDPQPPKAAL